MRNGDFLKLKGKNRSSYVVEDLIPTNRLVLWASPPGEGKSLLGAYVMYSIAYNAECFGKKVTTGNVMFIDSENRLDVLQSRAKKIKKGLEIAGHKKQDEVDFQHYTGFLLDDKSAWQKIETIVKAIQPCLIMLDHLAQFHTQNENKASAMTKVANAIGDLMNMADASVLVMHHFNKYDIGSFLKRLRGSSSIYANCDVACEIRSLSVNNGKLETVGIIPQRRKDITPDAFRVRIKEGKDWLQIVHDGNYEPVDDPTLDILAHKMYHVFLDPGNDEVTVNTMKAVVKGYANDTEVRRCLAFMEHTRGLITSDRKGLGGGFHYVLPPSPVKYRQCPWCNQRVLC